MLAANQTIELKRASIRIQGETPLLCKTLRPMGRDRWGFTTDGIFSALMTVAGHPLRGLVAIEGAGLVEICADDPTLRTDWVSDPAQQTVARHEFFPWEMLIRLRYDAARIKLDDLVSLFERAGFQVGLGSHRPACSGSFGTFTVRNVMDLSDAGREAQTQQSLRWPDEQRKMAR